MKILVLHVINSSRHRKCFVRGYIHMCVCVRVLFTGWDVRVVKNCDRGLENTKKNIKEKPRIV